MELPKPQAEHQWLQQLVGFWEFEHECRMGPDQPAMKWSGKQSTRLLGDLWTIGDMTGENPDGGDCRSIITLGFNPESKRFVGTFVSSVMTHMWLYEGTLDAAGKVLTLDSEGPSFIDGGSMVKYQDIFEIVDADQHRMYSQFIGPDQQWVRFMTGTFRRKK